MFFDFDFAEPEGEPSVADASPPTKKPRSSGRLALENPHKDAWMKGIGSKPFTIRFSHRLNKTNNCKKDEIPEKIDSEYYLDHLDPSKRKKFIHETKVTKEYMEEEQQKQLKLARKLTRELSVRGKGGQPRNCETTTSKMNERRQAMEVRTVKKEMMLKIMMGRTMMSIIEKLH